jgi:hypothetical protein
MTALDAEQARRFLLAARGTLLETLWVLAVTTGLRQGELLALRWAEVDLDRGWVRVTGTLTRIRQDVGPLATRRPTRSSPHPSRHGRDGGLRSAHSPSQRFETIGVARSRSVVTPAASGWSATWFSLGRRGRSDTHHVFGRQQGTLRTPTLRCGCCGRGCRVLLTRSDQGALLRAPSCYAHESAKGGLSHSGVGHGAIGSLRADWSCEGGRLRRRSWRTCSAGRSQILLLGGELRKL